MGNDRETWEELAALLERSDTELLREYLRGLAPGEIGRAVSRLTEENQARVLTLLPAVEAASLLVELSTAQAADLVATLPAAEAAAILNDVPVDERADVLAELDVQQAEEILLALTPEAAEGARRLAGYPPDTAGGLMTTEYVAYPADIRIEDVVTDLRGQAERYSKYDLQYVYVIGPIGELLGVLRLRDLLWAPPEAAVTSVMIASPHSIRVMDRLDEVGRFFDRYPFFGAPVTAADGRLLGVVLRADAEEALSTRAERRFLLASGVLGGEEFRTMPWTERLWRRGLWLGLSFCLSLLGASVIGVYEETLSAAIALAAFLPVISAMGGNFGNQALAVSVRELSLGLIQPGDFWWVFRKEVGIGLINGLLFGVLLATLAIAWKGDVYFGVVVGAAMLMSTLMAACLGGVVPLFLKQLDMDPAIATGPMLMAFNDLCGFFFALSFASVLLRP
jgi:magnesium transporter